MPVRPIPDGGTAKVLTDFIMKLANDKVKAGSVAGLNAAPVQNTPNISAPVGLSISPQPLPTGAVQTPPDMNATAIAALKGLSSGVPIDIKALLEELRAMYERTTGDISEQGVNYLQELLGSNLMPTDPELARLFAADPAFANYAGGLAQLDATAGLNQATDEAWFLKQQQAMQDYYNGLIAQIAAYGLPTETTGGGGGGGGYGGGRRGGGGGSSSDGDWSDPVSTFTGTEKATQTGTANLSENFPDFYSNLISGSPDPGFAQFAHELFYGGSPNPQAVGGRVMEEILSNEADLEAFDQINQNNLAWEAGVPVSVASQLASLENAGITVGDNPDTEDVIEHYYPTEDFEYPVGQAPVPFEEMQRLQSLADLVLNYPQAEPVSKFINLIASARNPENYGYEPPDESYDFSPPPPEVNLPPLDSTMGPFVSERQEPTMNQEIADHFGVPNALPQSEQAILSDYGLAVDPETGATIVPGSRYGEVMGRPSNMSPDFSDNAVFQDWHDRIFGAASEPTPGKVDYANVGDAFGMWHPWARNNARRNLALFGTPDEIEEVTTPAEQQQHRDVRVLSGEMKYDPATMMELQNRSMTQFMEDTPEWSTPENPWEPEIGEYYRKPNLTLEDIEQLNKERMWLDIMTPIINSANTYVTKAPYRETDVLQNQSTEQLQARSKTENPVVAANTPMGGDLDEFDPGSIDVVEQDYDYTEPLGFAGEFRGINSAIDSFSPGNIKRLAASTLAQAAAPPPPSPPSVGKKPKGSYMNFNKALQPKSKLNTYKKSAKKKYG